MSILGARPDVSWRAQDSIGPFPLLVHAPRLPNAFGIWNMHSGGDGRFVYAGHAMARVKPRFWRIGQENTRAAVAEAPC